MADERGLSFGNKPPETNATEFTSNRAYVIGINAYQNGIPQLRTAVADAERLGKLLKESHGYNVLSLPRNGSPTLATLRELLHKKMLQEVGANDRVLFYFAGHGIALDGEDGPEGFLVPEDANREDRSSFLPMTELNEALSKLPCRHFLLILDCCFAGAFRWSSTRDLSPLPSVIHKERYERYIQDPAWQVLTSAAHDQKALDVLSGSTIGQRVETEGHSPFAEALFRALEGEADLIPRGKNGQRSGDGVITATELYLYLRESVETATIDQKMRQTPGLWPLKKHDKGEYILLAPGHELNLPPAPELNYDNNPYRGLKSFEEEHSKLFFGREREIDELQKRVSSQSLTVVLGASGTGKSSLVKAGLLPYLRSAATNKWFVLPAIRVGSSPLATLASLLLPGEVSSNNSEGLVENFRTNENAFANRVKKWEEANPGTTHLLLAVDQFEELITLCKDTNERDLFISQLANAISLSPDRFRLVLTLRTDFEPQFADCTLKAHWMNGRYIVPPMSTDDLRLAIEGPASTQVLYLKPSGLIDLLVDEVIQTPGALPLLSFTMSELYVRYVERKGDDRCLTLADYEELGGVAGSLRSRASRLYDGLDSESQMTLKRIMLRMVSADGGNTARRRVPKSELEYPSKDENVRVANVLKLLSDARLVVEGKESDDAAYVEPAHDELIRGWDKLLTWMRDEQEELLLRSLLTPAANDWKHYQGGTWHANPRLALLKRIRRSDESWLNAPESSFVDRSISKRRTMHISLWSSVAAAFIVLALITRYAIDSRNNLAQQLASVDYERAHDRNDLRVALWHAYRAATIAPPNDPRCETYIDRTLFLAADLPNKLVTLENWHFDYISGVISPDLESVVVVTSAVDLAAWDLRSGKRLQLPTFSSIAGLGGDSSIGSDRGRGIASLQISSDSQLAMVLLGSDNLQDERLSVWKLVDGEPVFETLTRLLEYDYAFSADSQAVLQSPRTDSSELNPPHDRVWKTVWHATLVDEVGKAGLPVRQQLMLQDAELVYRSNRPADIKFVEPLGNIGLLARKSADGKTIASISSSGYAAFWKVNFSPFVEQVDMLAKLCVAVGSDGGVYSLDRSGTLIRTIESGDAKRVKIHRGDLESLERALIQPSLDGAKLLLFYWGTQKGDEKGGFELRDAVTLELLAEKRDLPMIGRDIRELAWLGGVANEFVFVDSHDSDYYIYVHRASVDAVDSKGYVEPKFQIPIGDFGNLTADGKYAITSFEHSEVLLQSTENSSLSLGPFRPAKLGVGEAAKILAEGFDLHRTDQGVTGKLRPNVDFLIVNEPSGAQFFVNGWLIDHAAAKSPVTWNDKGLRWFSNGEDKSSMVVDTETGFAIGQFPVESAEFRFVRNHSRVIAFADQKLWRITTGNELQKPPDWFESLPAAVTGVVMDDKKNLRTLPPDEHLTTRQSFLNALKQAAAAGDQAALRMHRYFGEL